MQRVINGKNMQNNHIVDSLNAYIENPDPRYALMLKVMDACIRRCEGATEALPYSR